MTTTAPIAAPTGTQMALEKDSAVLQSIIESLGPETADRLVSDLGAITSAARDALS